MKKLILIFMILGFLLAGASAFAKKPEVILSCECYSLRDYMNRGDYNCITVMKLMKSLGINGVSLNEIYMKSFDKKYLDEIKSAAKENGIILTALIVEGNLATDDETARKRQIQTDADRLKTAAYLGIHVVRLNIAGTGDQARDDTVGVDRTIKAFNELLPLARKLGIRMVIENHGGVSSKADNIVRIIKATDPKYVGACLDFKNWPKDDYYSEAAKVVPFAYHIHAKSHNFGPDGEETAVDYNRLLKMIRDSGYRGAISIEYEGKDDQIEGIRKTRDLILKYWKI